MLSLSFIIELHRCMTKQYLRIDTTQQQLCGVRKQKAKIVTIICVYTGIHRS